MITSFKIFENTTSKIESPRPNSVVYHTGWRFENNPNYPCHVYIIGGQYLSNDRVSNYWTWKRILPNGDLAQPEHNYGDFILPKVVMDDTYTEEEIKEIYPIKYKEYLIKKNMKKYNI